MADERSHSFVTRKNKAAGRLRKCFRKTRQGGSRQYQQAAGIVETTAFAKKSAK
jgi:hypothetical protein